MSKAIASALKDLSYAFPRQDVPDRTIGVYDRALDQFPEPAVLAAIEQAKMTRTFWPSISELTDIMAQHAHGPDDLAETAWLEVLGEVSRVGYQSQTNRIFRNGVFLEPEQPRFSTVRLTEAIASVGWKNICHGDQSEMRETFLWTYKSLRKRDLAKVQRADFSGVGTPDSVLSDTLPPVLKEVS